MNTALKITAFAAALAATFGTAYGVGAIADPVTSEERPAHGGHDAAAPAPKSPAGGDLPAGGLQVSESGYTLDLATPRIEAGTRTDLEFTIRDTRGQALTSYRKEHEKELHLIVASRDLNTFRHLHPVRAGDGTWSTPVSLPDAGGYRVFADFTPDASTVGNLTLGADLAVGGHFRPRPLPRAGATTEVDGYQVTLLGDLRPGRAGELTLKVSRDGRPVTDLQPYLGAYGHLVALRSGDLAYLHVHPNGEPGDGTTEPGPEISFTATAPTAGSYRLFLDFQHEGTVRTAAFTYQVAPVGSTELVAEPEATGGAEESESPSGGHGH